MSYEPYVDAAYYQEVYGGTLISDENLPGALRQASRHIDALTYNRIVGRGFDQLTEYQRELIQEVTCRQADFECENADVIDTVLQNYSINGVSMQFGAGWNVMIQSGVAMRRDVYALLSQAGLACRLAARR